MHRRTQAASCVIWGCREWFLSKVYWVFTHRQSPAACRVAIMQREPSCSIYFQIVIPNWATVLFVFTTTHTSGRVAKWRRPGNTYCVNDIRWTGSGCRGQTTLVLVWWSLFSICDCVVLLPLYILAMKAGWENKAIVWDWKQDQKQSNYQSPFRTVLGFQLMNSHADFFGGGGPRGDSWIGTKVSNSMHG